MKILTLVSLLFLLGSTNNVLVASERNVPEYLESICVKIKVNDGTGSGTAFTRKDWTGTNDVTFIWTAAHLFNHTEDVYSMLFFGQHARTSPIVDHAMVILPIFDKDGAVCGSTNRLAKVIKYSDNEVGQDLALLQLDGVWFNKNSAVFDLSGKPTRIGTKVISCASPYGLTDTYSEGHISMVGGMMLNSNVLDQTSCVVFPGSSGGGMFNEKGLYIGMTTMMRAAGLNFMVPMRRMQEWAKKEHIEWALDPSIPMPSKENFETIRVGDLIQTNRPNIIIGRTNNIHPTPQSLDRPPNRQR